MGVLWHKVWFDLWHNKTRTLLAVLSIAAGVFAVGAMFGMADMMSTVMDRSHQAVVPPHINIILSAPVDRDILLNLRSVPGVEGLEPYNSLSLLYRLRPDDAWRQGIVQMRDEYRNQQYELVQLRAGSWPNEKNELGIERMAAQYNKLGLGDKVTFKFGTTERTLAITSLIRHPFVPPPQFQDLSFFFMSGEGLQRFGIADGTFNSAFVRVTPYSTAYAKDVASAIKDKLAKQNIRVATFMYQDPDRHWGRAFMDGFNLVQEMLAVICILMSAVLVYNTLTNLTTQQTDQIGILKAIGARTSTIIAAYLVSAFVYGLLALIVALPLGAAVAYGITRYFLDLFNIEFAQFHVSRLAITLQVLAALAAPLLAGLPPIIQGASITVRQAFASYGIGGSYRSNPLDRAIERVGARVLSAPYATALGNMLRRKGRLLMTEIVLVTAGTAFLMVMSLSSSIGRTLDNLYSRRRYDTLIEFTQNQRAEQVTALTARVSGITAAELHLVQSAGLFVEGQLVKEAGIGTSVEGIPTGSDFFKPLIVGGRWLVPGDGHVVVITRDVADKNNIHLGDVVTLDLGELGKDSWTVVGLYDPVFAGAFSADTIYAPAEGLYRATKKFNQGTLLYLRTAAQDAASTSAATTGLKQLYEDRGLKVVQSLTQAEERQTNNFQFGIVVWMMLALSVIVALVGGIALMGALSIGVIERTKEIGVLRAVGARSSTILGIFIMEGVLQGLISWCIAAPLSLLTSPILARALGVALFGATLDYQYNWQAVVWWFVFIVVISGIASIVPANRATRISVRDSLAYA
jgi:putative ABC transport system permease protein